MEGNTKDDTTVIEQVNSLREKFNIEEVVIVGDRAHDNKQVSRGIGRRRIQLGKIYNCS